MNIKKGLYSILLFLSLSLVAEKEYIELEVFNTNNNTEKPLYTWNLYRPETFSVLKKIILDTAENKMIPHKTERIFSQLLEVKYNYIALPAFFYNNTQKLLHNNHKEEEKKVLELLTNSINCIIMKKQKQYMAALNLP